MVVSGVSPNSDVDEGTFQPNLLIKHWTVRCTAICIFLLIKVCGLNPSCPDSTGQLKTMLKPNKINVNYAGKNLS